MGPQNSGTNHSVHYRSFPSRAFSSTAHCHSVFHESNIQSLVIDLCIKKCPLLSHIQTQSKARKMTHLIMQRLDRALQLGMTCAAPMISVLECQRKLNATATQSAWSMEIAAKTLKTFVQVL